MKHNGYAEDSVVAALRRRETAMSKNADTDHPGLVLLRELIPDTEARRAFVKRACSRDEWYAPDLIRAVNDANESKPVNVTPQQAALVREFIESI